jgi:hypothetical protein
MPDTTEQKDNTSKIFEWGVLELFGRLKLAGKLSEESKFGTLYCRIDIPLTDGTFFPRFFSSGAIYGFAPVTEAQARAFAKHVDPSPIAAWEIPELTRNQLLNRWTQCPQLLQCNGNKPCSECNIYREMMSAHEPDPDA